MTDKEIVETFIDAAKIASPSGKESKMAKWVKVKMADEGWKAWEDKGNVYAYLGVSEGLPTIVFSAHLDTVQKQGEQINPIFDGKVFKSDGKTILGADNKAGVTSLVLTAKRLKGVRLKTNILFFFPVREEAGKMGSAFFDPGKLKVKYVFNVDSSDEPGVFVYKSLGYINFEIEVTGLAAHAAKSYEEGKDSIVAMAKLVSSLPLGKNIKEGWTLNLGSVYGGESTNVVCDKIVMRGELRGFEVSVMEKVKKTLEDSCKRVAAESGCDIKLSFDDDSYISPFVGNVRSEQIMICKRACGKINLKFKLKESFSTSDANSFGGLGYQVVSVSRGGKNAHSNSEELALADLKDTVKFLREICCMV